MSNRLDLKEMSIDDLLDLRSRVNETLKGRLDAERRALEERLARLNEAAAERSNESRPSPLKGRKLVPKYRNPQNPSQTWAGRGQMPAWMAAAVAAGASIADFEITRSTPGSKAARGKGRRRG
jgi:DNA-binding protein H-NS